MNSKPDFDRYSIAELEEAYVGVDRAKHPENYQEIVCRLKQRKAECAAEYAAAGITLIKEGIEAARQQFQQVAHKYPGTPEAKKAAVLLKNNPRAEGEKRGEDKEDQGNAFDRLPELQLAFHGTAGEYFRIWIVNLSLTLLSCGIFSAWAKVRKKRYIYSHLTLDGTPFQYLGQPIPILKGRIIAAFIFLVYYSSTNFFTPLLPYVFAAGLILAPWVLVQTIAFNSRYTAYRNITFRFHGNYKQAFTVLSAWGYIPVLVIGTLFDWWGMGWLGAVLFAFAGFYFPWWLRNVKHFIVTRTSYGGVSGQFRARGGEFFKIYFMAGLIVAGFGIITGFLLLMTFSSFAENYKYAALTLSGISYLGYIISFAYVQAHITNAVWNQVSVGPIRFGCTLSGKEMVKLYLTNVLAIIASAGLLIPWAVIRTLRYRVEQTRVRRAGELAAFQSEGREDVAAIGAEVTDFFDFDLAI